MKKSLLTVILLVSLVNVNYSQRYVCDTNLKPRPVNKSVIYHNNLQRKLRFKTINENGCFFSYFTDKPYECEINIFNKR
jgi:hypothetical protein